MNKKLIMGILLGISFIIIIAAFIIMIVMPYSDTRTTIMIIFAVVFALTAIPASCIQYKIRKEENNKSKK